MGTVRATNTCNQQKPTLILHPGTGRIDGDYYLPVTPQTVRWGWWPNGETPAVLSVRDRAVVTVDTLSHEGILEDQGRDPDAFFATRGVKRSDVLRDATEIARDVDHTFGVDGPHVVTGPIEVRGARPGDLLKVDVLGFRPESSPTASPRTGTVWVLFRESCPTAPSRRRRSRPARRRARSLSSPRSKGTHTAARLCWPTGTASPSAIRSRRSWE